MITDTPSHGESAPAGRRSCAVGLLAVASGAAGGCGGDDGETLRVYSGRHYDVELAFAQFSEETGIDVEFLTGDDAELRERIAAEGEDTEADVYLTVDAGNLAAAAEDGLFQPLDSPILDEAIPAEYRDPQDRWFGLALRTRTIVYNPEAARPRTRCPTRTRSWPTRSGRVGCACATPTTPTSSRSSPA